MKAFPVRKEAQFWNIVANHVLSTQPMLNEQDRNLHGQLSYRTIAKAAKASIDVVRISMSICG